MPGDWVCTAVSGVTVAVSVSNSTVEIAMIGHPDNEDWFREVDSAHVVRTNIPTKVRVRCDYVADELDYLLPYTDGDFEEWRDLIMPHLERGYVITLSKIAKGARSSLLRKEASKLLARNAAACKAPEK
jgi:hypothetical protein